MHISPTWSICVPFLKFENDRISSEFIPSIAAFQRTAKSLTSCDTCPVQKNKTKKQQDTVKSCCWRPIKLVKRLSEGLKKKANTSNYKQKNSLHYTGRNLVKLSYQTFLVREKPLTFSPMVSAIIRENYNLKF